jgi:hypothetical protein
MPEPLYICDHAGTQLCPYPDCEWSRRHEHLPGQQSGGYGYCPFEHGKLLKIRCIPVEDGKEKDDE